MIYTSVLAAVVSALAAETIDNTSKQAWQKLYRPGYQDGLDLATLIRSGGSDGIQRIDADCWVFARLHSQLKSRHWDALVARYSTHKGRKVDSIGKLCPLIASHAPRLFVQKAITVWAIPQLKGMDGKRSTDMIILPARFYDMAQWDDQGLNRSTYWRWRKQIEDRLDEMVKEALNAAGELLRNEGVILNEAA